MSSFVRFNLTCYETWLRKGYPTWNLQATSLFSTESFSGARQDRGFRQHREEGQTGSRGPSEGKTQINISTSYTITPMSHIVSLYSCTHFLFLSSLRTGNMFCSFLYHPSTLRKAVLYTDPPICWAPTVYSLEGINWWMNESCGIFTPVALLHFSFAFACGLRN